MERKEPYATQEEFNRRVIHYPDVPPVVPAPAGVPDPGFKSYVVSAEKMTVAFVDGDPNFRDSIHHHEAEQIMIVTDGACDVIADGKLYHLEKDDVIILPSNIEHGAYMSDRGCRIIEIWSPPRQDYLALLEAVKRGLKT